MNVSGYKEKALDATVPTGFTKYLRTCVLFQLLRFAIINLKMIRVIFRSHA